MKGERKEYRQVQTRKVSKRMEADKALAHGTRLAYLKEKSRKRAAAHRGAGSKERAIERVAREEEAERLFNKPSTGRKRQTFPLSEGALSTKELEAVPMSRREKRHMEGLNQMEFLNSMNESGHFRHQPRRRLRQARLRRQSGRKPRRRERSKSHKRSRRKERIRKRSQRVWS